MHFHLPKPLHGWREFAGEVGIIVVGVLIALGAEQVVEQFRSRAEVRNAEDGMVTELRDDDVPQAYFRAAIHDCYVDQLDAIEAAIDKSDRTQVKTLGRGYAPVYRTWDDQAWKAALASQALTQAGAQRMTAWATAYVFVPKLDQAAIAEQSEVAQLRAGLSGTGRLSAEQQDRLFQVVASLRRFNGQMSGGSLALMKVASGVGIRLSSQERRTVLAEARSLNGPCVQEPSFDRFNTTSQLPNKLFRK